MDLEGPFRYTSSGSAETDGLRGGGDAGSNPPHSVQQQVDSSVQLLIGHGSGVS